MVFPIIKTVWVNNHPAEQNLHLRFNRNLRVYVADTWKQGFLSPGLGNTNNLHFVPELEYSSQVEQHEFYIGV